MKKPKKPKGPDAVQVAPGVYEMMLTHSDAAVISSAYARVEEVRVQLVSAAFATVCLSHGVEGEGKAEPVFDGDPTAGKIRALRVTLSKPKVGGARLEPAAKGEAPAAKG